ncbi:MAG: hypothetical protein FWC85_03615 [Elusimicrobia bacterium]|nr:hypothetical protein [Elusimicrobiota bacterium]
MEQVNKYLSNALGVLAAVTLGAFLFFVANHYYDGVIYKYSLKPNLEATVFFVRGSEGGEEVCAFIEEEASTIRVLEYISAEYAFTRAVEIHPYLAEFSAIADSLQAFAVLSLTSKEDIELLKFLISNIENVDEIVYNPAIFERHYQLYKTLKLLEEVFFVLMLLGGGFFIVKSILFFMGEGNIKQYALNLGAAGLACFGGYAMLLLTMLIFKEQAFLVHEDMLTTIVPVYGLYVFAIRK